MLTNVWLRSAVYVKTKTLYINLLAESYKKWLKQHGSLLKFQNA